MHSIQLTTDHAFPTLVEKLSNVSGVVIVNVDSASRGVTCQYETHLIANLAQALTNTLLNEWLFAELVTQLQSAYERLSVDELEYITLVILHEIRSSDDLLGNRSYRDWEQRACRGFQTLLQTERPFSIEGFVRFRMRQLMTSLTHLLSERIQQFTLDREYEESVAMLRFMLQEQPPSSQELHVFCSPEQVWLTDETGCLIRDSEVTEAALAQSEGELDSEDLAMSILIMRSPCRIVLHDMHPEAAWPSFPETLTRVFAERVERCQHCSTCQQLEQMQNRFPNVGSHLHRFR